MSQLKNVQNKNKNMKSFRIVSSTKSEEQICLSFYDKKLGLEIDQASKIQLFRDTTE